jgi:hypothetical protein
MEGKLVPADSEHLNSKAPTADMATKGENGHGQLSENSLRLITETVHATLHKDLKLSMKLARI